MYKVLRGDNIIIFIFFLCPFLIKEPQLIFHTDRLSLARSVRGSLLFHQT